MKKSLRCAVSVISLIAGFSVVSASLVYAGTEKEADTVYNDDAVTENVEYSVNAYGQTYGIENKNIVGEVHTGDFPDLIPAIGDNGKKGYVYMRDILGEPPASPEEVLKIQESKDNGTYSPKVINVYESDGKTIVDVFTETLCD